jgi:hypothetical protein
LRLSLEGIERERWDGDLDSYHSGVSGAYLYCHTHPNFNLLTYKCVSLTIDLSHHSRSTRLSFDRPNMPLKFVTEGYHGYYP